MYIPTQFFGQVNTCISASGGDVTGEFISGSTVWKYHKFTTLGSSSFTIHSGSSNDFRVLLVGGGGGGGRALTGPGGSPVGAGGGGAGGVVYTDFRFGPGSHNLYIGDGGNEDTSGEDTWLVVNYEPSNYQGYYPTSSQLTAEGGGHGAALTWYTGTPDRPAEGGGSGGGAARGLVEGLVYQGLPRNGGRTPQGNGGGSIYIPGGGSTSFQAGAGGGGAAESGSDADFVSSARTAARGGHGRLLNVDGADRYYGAGGGGRGEAGWPTSVSNGSNYYGAGGSGSHDGTGGNPGTLNGHDLRDGRQGIAVIMYPICTLDLEECTTYLVNGGLSGGNITFVPCGIPTLETLYVSASDQFTICSYPISGYPSASGTVSTNATGSCNQYTDPATGSQCDVGFTLEVLNQTEIVVTAPDVGPYPGYRRYSYLDYNYQTKFTGNLSTGTYDYCAIPSSVTLLAYTAGSSDSITYTSTPCGYYCSGSPESGITSGSIVDEFIFNTGSAYSTSSQLPTFDWVTSSVSLEVWSKESSLDGTYDVALGLNDQAAGGDRDFIEIRYRNVSGVKLFGNNYDGSSDTVTQPYGDTVSGLWYHSILTWDTGSGQMLYYRDGSLIGSASVPTITTELNNPYYHVGRSDTGNEDFMNIGEYRIYPFALNSTQVQTNYNETKARYGY